MAIRLVMHAEDPDMGTAEPTNLAELHRAKQAAKSAEEALAEYVRSCCGWWWWWC